MARPLRIERIGGRYHATARGNERRDIFRDDTDRYHFLELLSEAKDRFGVLLHAYVLMDNHFHLMVETPEANLSRTMQWVEVSYSIWFNKRHRRAGHLFQGRFKACIVEEDTGWQEVARYVHLNPVRLGKLGLSKKQQVASRQGMVGKPDPGVIAERLRVLRQYRWSSYPGYAGYAPALQWVCQEPLNRLCGGRTEAQRREALRQHTESAILQGAVERPWDRLVAGVVLGSQSFARSLKQGLRIKEREQRQARKLAPPPTWDRIIAAIEKVRGQKWEEFSGRYGDWGRDSALWLGRREGRLSLAQLGGLAGGLDYAAVSVAVQRFGRKLEKQPRIRSEIEQIQRAIVEC